MLKYIQYVWIMLTMHFDMAYVFAEHSVTSYLKIKWLNVFYNNSIGCQEACLLWGVALAGTTRAST